MRWFRAVCFWAVCTGLSAGCGLGALVLGYAADEPAMGITVVAFVIMYVLCLMRLIETWRAHDA